MAKKDSKIESTEKLTKFEKARILGSRSLQIAMGAPFLVKITEKQLEEIRYDPLEIAKKELAEGVIPITIVRPMPKVERLQKENKTPN